MRTCSYPTASASTAQYSRRFLNLRGIMREQGVAVLLMQELAHRLDMRAPSIYNNFASKMEI
jgi:hypothetical protein